MKKKVMRTIFFLLFIAGIVVGYLLPGDLMSLKKQATGENKLKAAVFDVPKKLGQLDKETPYFKYGVLAETETGSVELIRLEQRVPMHIHPKENHFLYVYKGRAKGTIGNSSGEVAAGQLIAIPAGVPHSFERIGDTPVEIIVFSTPPFIPNDTVVLEK